MFLNVTKKRKQLKSLYLVFILSVLKTIFRSFILEVFACGILKTRSEKNRNKKIDYS